MGAGCWSSLRSARRIEDRIAAAAGGTSRWSSKQAQDADGQRDGGLPRGRPGPDEDAARRRRRAKRAR